MLPNLIPLTPEQRLLAGAPAHLGWARSIARSRARSLSLSHLREEFESAAFMGLVEAARTYDERCGASFKTHSMRRILGAIADYGRAMALKGYRRGIEHVPGMHSLDRPSDSEYVVLSDDLPVGWEMESEDEVKAMSRRVWPRHGMAVRLYYLHAACATMKVTGEVLGVSEARVCVMHKEAIAEVVATAGGR